MGLVPNDVGAWSAGKSNGRRKDGEDERIGCWIKIRFFRSCISSRSKVDSSISGTSTQCESKSTIDMSEDQPVAPVPSSSTTSNTESALSTINIEEELKISSQLRKFAFHELKSSTRSFRPESLLGEGGFGCVFKGWINENGSTPVKPGTGLAVAVKTLNHDGLQGHKEWLAEVQFLGVVSHVNLVKLFGYCSIDGDGPIQRLLVYEFMPNRSLDDHLFNRALPVMPWKTRLKIILGAAQGLAYLHNGLEVQVIYRDFKSSNVLLDVDFTPKLSDFGLAREGPKGDKTHVSTAVVGTYGYAAPEYVQTGRLKSHSDLWSFGVVLYEILTGRRALDRDRPAAEQKLVDWVKQFPIDSKKFNMIMDPRLRGQYSLAAARMVAKLANKCLNKSPVDRPAMAEVVEILKQALQETEERATSENRSCHSAGYKLAERPVMV